MGPMLSSCILLNPYITNIVKVNIFFGPGTRTRPQHRSAGIVPVFPLFDKILMRFNVIVCLCVFAFLSASAAEATAQKVTLRAHETVMTSVFESIRQQTV